MTEIIVLPADPITQELHALRADLFPLHCAGYTVPLPYIFRFFVLILARFRLPSGPGFWFSGGTNVREATFPKINFWLGVAKFKSIAVLCGVIKTKRYDTLTSNRTQRSPGRPQKSPGQHDRQPKLEPRRIRQEVANHSPHTGRNRKQPKKRRHRMKKENRGGPRPGSGRPRKSPTGERSTRYTFWITPENRAALLALPEGERGAAINKAIQKNLNNVSN